MSDDWNDYSTCHSVGMGGGCDIDCPVLGRGDCPIEEEMICNLKELYSNEELIDYGLVDDDHPFDLFDDAMEIIK